MLPNVRTPTAKPWQLSHEVQLIAVGLLSPLFKRTPYQAAGISPLHRELKAMMSHNVAH